MKPWLRWAGFGLVAAGVLTIGLAIINHSMCWYMGWQLERETRYRIFVGCMTKTANGWLPLEQLREVE